MLSRSVTEAGYIKEGKIKLNFTSSEIDFVKDNEAYVPAADSDKRRIGSVDELDRLLAFRDDPLDESWISRV